MKPQWILILCYENHRRSTGAVTRVGQRRQDALRIQCLYGALEREAVNATERQPREYRQKLSRNSPFTSISFRLIWHHRAGERLEDKASAISKDAVEARRYVDAIAMGGVV